MPQLSQVDRSQSPPRLELPRQYNAAHDLIGRNLAAGRADKLAFIDDFGRYRYADLEARSNRVANALLALGMRPEERLFLCAHDTFDFPCVFLGAIKTGIVPVAVNTLLTPADYAFMLNDCRASVAVIAPALLPVFAPLAASAPDLKHLLITHATAAPADSNTNTNASAAAHTVQHHSLDALLQATSDSFTAIDRTPDDACFWLYSSGSTGAPKGTVHAHGSLMQTAELFALPMLGLRESDVMFSAAKLFFAYGLGNALTFPLSIGATTVLMAERPTPDAVFKRWREHRPTIFYGAPTGYAGMLASPNLPRRDDVALRLCSSAGEPLPQDIGRRWQAHFGVDIIDGIGSTEMLHVFLSNHVHDVRYGTTGRAVPGYELRLVDEVGQVITAPDTQGELQIKGPTAALGYWNNREKTRSTFQGEWTRSGDKYLVNAEGYYVYCGRNDDMLKVSGIYVSPIEVEAALITHPAVLEAAVIGHADADGLIKPKAFVVLKDAHAKASPPELDAMRETLKAHVKSQLAPYKYPRWFEFVPDLPKTATGKIQRFKLRALAQASA